MFFRKILLLIACTVLAYAAVAQQTSVSLRGGEMTLSELFGEIRRQTDRTVIFNAGKVPPSQTVSVPAGEIAVSEVLGDVLSRRRYAWQFVGSYVVVRSLPEQPATLVATPLRQPTREDFERDVAEYTRLDPTTSRSEVIVHRDTVRTVTRFDDGTFRYGDREFLPVRTGRVAQTSFGRPTPPMLAVKTNLVWWAARGTINLGGEIGLGKRTSLEVSGGLNRWNLEGSMENNRKLTHWIVKPEFRYWLCERFSGHFFGIHALYGQYNVGQMEIPMLFEKEYRYEGYGFGGGVNYGYHLPLAKRWGVEFTAGVGAVYLDYKKSDCPKCAEEIAEENKTYFGPTQLGVKLIFMIK